MAGIYIKGMEMPTACMECVFYRATDPVYDYCCISSVVPQNYIPEDCPLVPVPPHGRLIDADALIQSEKINTFEAVFAVAEAPTIFPAEDGLYDSLKRSLEQAINGECRSEIITAEEGEG